MKRLLKSVFLVLFVLIIVSCSSSVGPDETIKVYKNFKSVSTKDISEVSEPITGIAVRSLSFLEGMADKFSGIDLSTINEGIYFLHSDTPTESNFGIVSNYFIFIPDVIVEVYKEGVKSYRYKNIQLAEKAFFWFINQYYDIDVPQHLDGWTGIINFLSEKDYLATPKLKDMSKVWRGQNPIINSIMSDDITSGKQFVFTLTDLGKEVMLYPEDLVVYFEANGGKNFGIEFILWVFDAYFGLNENQIEKKITEGSFKSYVETVVNPYFASNSIEGKEIAKKYKAHVTQNSSILPDAESASMVSLLSCSEYDGDVLIKQGIKDEKITDTSKIYFAADELPGGSYECLCIYFPSCISTLAGGQGLRKYAAFLKSLDTDLAAIITHNGFIDLYTDEFCDAIKDYSFYSDRVVNPSGQVIFPKD